MYIFFLWKSFIGCYKKFIFLTFKHTHMKLLRRETFGSLVIFTQLALLFLLLKKEGWNLKEFMR